VVIDGSTQPGFAGTPLIQLNGTGSAAVNGLTITAGYSTVQYLNIRGFYNGSGLQISGNGSDVIANNYIGTDVTGISNHRNQVGLEMMASNSWIVGNLISGNATGLLIAGDGNLLQGNVIGPDVTGRRALANVTGIRINGAHNTVGGTAAGAGNLISGNNGAVLIYSNGNLVQGNYIGTDASGTQGLGNNGGVYIYGSDNTVGGTAAGAGNLISRNTGALGIFGSGNLVQGNYIGTDITGTQALGNNGGVDIYGSDNTVGGTAAGAANLISGNNVALDISSNGNVVQGNYIGTDITGTHSLRNNFGVEVVDGSGNTIGGTEAGAANLISGNGAGVAIYASGNLVQGNYIGTDITGTQGLGNVTGVAIGGSGNTVGGTMAGAGNLISGNGAEGVSIVGDGNIVQGNDVGTDSTGSQALGNAYGVLIDSGSNNLIGGTTAGAGNTIAFNRRDGVLVNQDAGNAVLRNAIFRNGNLGIELTNGGNHDQEAPVITSATSGGGVTTLSGMLQSAPNTRFVIELFVNQTCDPSGLGEGEQFLASLTVTTDSGGAASFTLALAIDVPPGEFLTATATDPEGNTSEFSACAEVSGLSAQEQSLAGAMVGDRLPAPLVQPKSDLIPDDRAVTAALVPPNHLDGFFGSFDPGVSRVPRSRLVLARNQDWDAGSGWEFLLDHPQGLFQEL
jgi:titin